jgi:hypothetical protein
MKLKNLFLLLLAGTAFAHPPPPDSPPYVPPPTFIDLDDDVLNNDVVLETALKGIWETKTGVPPLMFEITGPRYTQFGLRVLTQSFCKELLIDKYALTISFEEPSSARDLRITMAEIKFDGDREDANCLGMPVWITFKFSSPPNYNTASVTVREQFVTGPDENVYEMTRTH